MNTEDLKNRFKKETGLDVNSGVMTYSTSYVNWIEKQLLIHSVSDTFSADDMRIAFEDGEHYGKGGDALIFDIENYR